MRLDHVISLMWINPFDSSLEFHERAVVGHVDHPADHAPVHRVAFDHRVPRVRLQLFNAERYPFLAAIELEHLDGDLVTHMENFRRMGHASVRHVGHV